MSQIPIKGRGTSSETPYFMGEFTHSKRQTFTKHEVPTWDNTTRMGFHIILVYLGTNKHDGKMY